MDKFDPFFSLGGRVLMAFIFLYFGIDKFSTLEGTQGYMESMGVSGSLIYPTIALEIGAALAIIVGFQTRLAALSLAAFTLVAALIFHSHSDDQIQIHLFLRNLAMVGGFLYLARHGAGEWSYDTHRLKISTLNQDQ